MPAHALGHPMPPAIDPSSPARPDEMAATRRQAIRALLIGSGVVLGAAGYVALLATIILVGLTSAVGA